MQTDTTPEFEAELAQWDGFATQQNRDGSIYTATDSELATLLQTAKHARAAAPWTWAKLHSLLKRHGGFKNDKDIRQEVTRARVHASLGCNPHTVQEFVPAWLSAKGYDASTATKQVSGATWYVVRVGRFRDRTAAKALETKLRSEEGLEAASVIVQ